MLLQFEWLKKAPNIGMCKVCLHERDNFMAGTECKEEVKSSSFLHLIQHVVICMRRDGNILLTYSVDKNMIPSWPHWFSEQQPVHTVRCVCCCGTLKMLFSAWLQGQDNSRRGWSLDKSHRPDSSWYFSPGQKLTAPGTAVFSCSRCTLMDLFQKTMKLHNASVMNFI